MKVLIFSVLLVSLVWLPVTAQVYQPLADLPESGIVSIGLRGGIGLSTVVGQDAADSLSVGGTPAYKMGLTLGLVVTSHLRTSFWLGHELWLQQQGAVVYLRDEGGQPYASRLRVQYLNVYPANFTFVSKQIQVYAGPYLGMALSASIQYKDTSGQLRTDPSVFGNAQTLSGYVSKIDAGLCVGIDYAVKSRWTIGLRLQRGVIPIWRENTLSQNGQAKVYNQSGLLDIGYQLSY